MEKVISAFDTRRKFGKILQEVFTRKDKFIIERHGEPVAALVPIEVYEYWKKGRNALFEKWRAAAERANMSPEEADALAEEAVQSIRSEYKG